MLGRGIEGGPEAKSRLCRWEYMGGPWKPLKAYWLKGEEQHPENEAAKPPN